MTNLPPQKKVAKTLRVLYPIWMLIGMFGMLYVPAQTFVSGDAVATAEAIASNELLFRFGIAARLITQLLGIVIPLLLYVLFQSFHRPTAMLMLAFSLIGIPISMYVETDTLYALNFFDNPEQLMHYLKMKWTGLNMAMIFWGLWLLPLGFLAKGSGMFPKFVGYALYLAGFGYCIGAFLDVLFPEAEKLYSIFEIFTIGEVVFILWFVIRGAKLNATVHQT